MQKVPGTDSTFHSGQSVLKDLTEPNRTTIKAFLPGRMRQGIGTKYDLARTGIIVGIFLVLVSIVSGVVYLVAGLSDKSEVSGTLQSQTVGPMLLLLVASVILILLLLILHALIRLLEQRQGPPASLSPPAADQPPMPELPQNLLQGLQNLKALDEKLGDMTALLHEIAENSLLDQAGRVAKLQRLAQQEREDVFKQVKRLMLGRQWSRARNILEKLGSKYPQASEISTWQQEFESARKDAMDQDCAQTEKTVEDLMAISAWDRAEELAEELLEKHPDSEKAARLVKHVQLQYRRFDQDQIQRMFAEIERCIARKRWTGALSVARQLMELHPDSVEAQSLKSQIKTIEANAEIEHRQNLEQQITDLLKHHQFIEALKQAQQVIQQYPHSPQAQALRDQMDKLEQMARKQENQIYGRPESHDDTAMLEPPADL